VHPTQEWHDLYRPETIDDLSRFFDHYLKDASNGWKDTPKVRLSCLRFTEVKNIIPYGFDYLADSTI
jgi:hypothetical protein